MKFLHSNMLPINFFKEQESIAECFWEQFAKSDQVEIAVGYISKASLIELYNMVEK